MMRKEQGMFKKNNKPCNPWVTFAYAILKAIFAIGWGYWCITGINQQNIWLITVPGICFATCMSDSVRLLLRADKEADEYRKKV
jgi:hypothetical protein